jgi:hypothetical protein
LENVQKTNGHRTIITQKMQYTCQWIGTKKYYRLHADYYRATQATVLNSTKRYCVSSIPVYQQTADFDKHKMSVPYHFSRAVSEQNRGEINIAMDGVINMAMDGGIFNAKGTFGLVL